MEEALEKNFDTEEKSQVGHGDQRKPRKLGWELTIGETTKFGVRVDIINIIVILNNKEIQF